MISTRRKLKDEDVRIVRSDRVLRANALHMLRLAREILRTVPSQSQHARRLGMHPRSIVEIAQGRRYKEIR